LEGFDDEGVDVSMADGTAVLKWLRHPAGITAIVVATIAVVIWSDRVHNQPDPISASPQAAASAPALGGELPAIVKRFGEASKVPDKMPSKSEKAPAPGLVDLLAGLESKVKADPANIGNRLLLAQTYQELGQRDKALKEARDIAEKNPNHPRARLVLASILSTSQQQSELNEAVALLDGLRSVTEVKQYLVQLYLGDAFIRLGDHQGAIKNWKAALEDMPAMDNRRDELQKRITDLGRNA
jgi:predicted negative regulator of RcsB-dependent stress response